MRIISSRHFTRTQVGDTQITHSRKRQLQLVAFLISEYNFYRLKKFTGFHRKLTNREAHHREVALTHTAVRLKAQILLAPGDGNRLQFTDVYKHISVKESAKYFCALDRPFSVNIVGAQNLDGVRGLSNAKLLATFSLSGSEISDLSELKYLKNLEGLVMGQSAGHTSDLTPLRDLINLKQLTLDSAAIRDLSPIQNLSNVTTLSIGGTGVSDLSALRNFRHLRVLGLKGSRVTDLSPIADIASLEELTIGGDQIPSLPALRKLPKLTKLSLFESRPVDLTPIGELTQLEDLSIYGPVKLSLSPLRRMKKLSSLSLTQYGDFSSLMQLEDPNAIAELHELRKLVLFEVQITDVTFMVGLSKLTEFSAINCPVVNIKDIEHAQSLVSVQFTNAPLVEILLCSICLI